MFLNMVQDGRILLNIHQQALNRAASSANPHHRIFLDTVGIIFLASPFRGSGAAGQAKWRLLVEGIMGRQVSDALIRDLDVKTGLLQHLVQTFTQNVNAAPFRIPIHCFYETRKTRILRSVLNRKIADFVSAHTPTCPYVYYTVKLHITLVLQRHTNPSFLCSW